MKNIDHMRSALLIRWIKKTTLGCLIGLFVSGGYAVTNSDAPVGTVQLQPTTITAPAATVAVPASTAAPAAPTTTLPQANVLPPVPPKPVSAAVAKSKPTIVTPTPVAPDVDAKGYILVDADSGVVIAQRNADQRMAPASLTKLMTMYVISGFIENGRLKLTDQVTVSENAWRTGGSRMFIQVGTQVPVQDLINGIVIASGNDACVAMAEHLAGTEQSFVDMMNKTAQDLGMKNTHYADATGLPNPTNYTTPYDLSLLTRAIIENYPEDYKWYSQKWMLYNNIRQPNRNLLLWRDPSVDGLKTGHTDDAGYCLVSSAKRNDMRLIAIIMGSSSTKQRANAAQALLNYGFSFYQTHKLYAANTPLTTLRIHHGRDKQSAFGLSQPLVVTIPTNQSGQLKAMLGMQPDIRAPITKGKPYGVLQVRLGDQVIANQPIVALADNPEASVISRWMDDIGQMFKRWFTFS